MRLELVANPLFTFKPAFRGRFLIAVNLLIGACVGAAQAFFLLLWGFIAPWLNALGVLWDNAWRLCYALDFALDKALIVL